MRGIVIKSPWLELILEGTKTWEVRSKATAVRERIALIRSQSGHIFGSADLVACHGAFTRDAIMQHQDKHLVPPERMHEVDYAQFFGWELKNVRRFANGIPYRHPQGAVIWVTLTDENVTGRLAALAAADSAA